MVQHRDELPEPELRRLLAYLARSAPPASDWRGWHIAAATGGANNRVYHVWGQHGDYAVKWTIRDQRGRAAREFAALTALAARGLPVAPAPVLLDEASYPLPVVVQGWVAGEPLQLPTTDAAWLALVEHYWLVHGVTPEHAGRPLQVAVLDADSPTACRDLVRQQLAMLPVSARPPTLDELARRLDAALPASWPAPPVALCRVDPNSTNFIQSDAGLVSIDWENSGWGDPAFDLAQLMTHPAYHSVAGERWTFVMALYGALAGDAFVPMRIAAYRQTMLVWWVVRLTRMLHEVAHGGDQRLVARPPEWAAQTRALLDHFGVLAAAELAVPGP